MKHPQRLLLLVVFFFNSILQDDAGAQFLQQGSKLVGTGATGNAYQGSSVALSSDGNTAIVGGFGDHSDVGAVWIFARSAGVWTQQGSKLVGTGVVGTAGQGVSVSMSADGNTAIVGGYGDNSDVGAVWVFTRSAGVWSQQGNKLVGTGGVGSARQGSSVSLSADGNTAIVGGTDDNSNVGAAWVFTRSGGVWSQQGNKLVGTGAAGTARQGSSVSLSADGNTAAIGGYYDSGLAGAAWIFTRSGGIWSQQGNKLVGTGAAGKAYQGSSVSLSSDGNTAIVGGYSDSSGVGAAWVYTRSGSVWSQQGQKLVGTDAVGTSYQGYSVSLSADGNTAIAGGYGDNLDVGAVWVFTRSGGAWSQKGNKLAGTGGVGSVRQGSSVSLSADGNTAIAGGAGDNGSVGAAWVFYQSSSGVREQAEAPLEFVLAQNYPNPFNPSTTIEFALPRMAPVTLAVYDLLGREIAVLVNERRDAGLHGVTFDGSGIATGVYLYRLQAGDFVQTKRLILLK
jgi:hypothetical protein